MLQYDLLMSTDQRINAHYMAAGALKDSRVMEALLGELPASHQMELQGFMLGLVHGTDVNARMRTDVVDSGFSTRVLVPNRTASVTARLYTGPVSYTHLRAHETVLDLVCRLLLEKKN